MKTYKGNVGTAIKLDVGQDIMAATLLQIEVLKPAGNPNAPGLKTAMHHQPARRERALFCQDHA